MDGKRFGVIVGVNACVPDAGIPALGFAERDARAVYDHLTDDVTGTFDPALVRLLTGSAATTVDVKAALREAALDLGPSDVLFVYFAGHAIVSPWLRYPDPYLVTSDLNPNALRSDPDRGLRMSFLWRDVFEAIPGSSFLILDTCHAGAFLDLTRTHTSRRDRIGIEAIEEAHEIHPLSRYSGLFACAPAASARETTDLAQGVLTYHVLRGMEGEAANQVGEVTFEALVDYVRRQDIDPIPGSVAQGWGPATVLTRLAGKRRTNQEQACSSSSCPTGTIEPLANPLDTHLSSLQLFLDRIFRISDDRMDSLSCSDHISRLNFVRCAVDAAAAAEVRLVTGEVVASAGNLTGMSPSDLIGGTLAQIADSKSALGFKYLQVENGGPRQLIVVIRDNGGLASALILTDPAPCFLYIGEPLAVVLQTLWRLLPINDPVIAEIGVLSSLRAAFGRVPLQLYKSCLEVYTQLLESLVIVFEPIMILSSAPEIVGIHSWEALARRNNSARKAPLDVLEAAEIWGDRFIIERDTMLASKAITSYKQAHGRGPWNHDSLKPLSINVSVRSLLSEGYEHALGQMITDAGIAPHTITLEISERDSIEPRPDEIGEWLPTPIVFFQNRLRHLARALRVDFAIDDFGVGHASLDRVSGLDLAQIKVDRSILHHSTALKELELVVQLADDALNRSGSGSPRPVIVEGFDDESPISLRDLHAHGIGYVQGYITGEAASTYLHPLSEDVRHRVAALVRGVS